MIRVRRRTCVSVVLRAALAVASATFAGISSAAVTQEQRAMYERLLNFRSMVKGGDVTPVWRSDGARFIYASGSGSQRRFLEVDPAAGTRRPFLDEQRLRTTVAAAMGANWAGEGVALENLAFVSEERAVRFEIQGRWFELELQDFVLRELSPEQVTSMKRRKPQTTGSYFPSLGSGLEVPSPNGELFLRTKDSNLWLRDIADNQLTRLTGDGVDRYGWLSGIWAPEGRSIVAFKVDARQVYHMPVVRWLKRQAEVSYHIYPQAGGPLPQQQLHFIDVYSGAKVAVEMGDDATYLRPAGWHPSRHEFLFFWLSRNGKRVELRAAHRTTGHVRVLWAEERDSTFVVGPSRFMMGTEPDFAMLTDGRFIVSSERSGWNQLYLYGRDKAGNSTLLTQLTRSEYPVTEIARVDEKAGLVYFTAHSDMKRVYDTHLMRVDLNGRGLKQLTEATGDHGIRFSPSGEYFLDSHSAAARPPATELRRVDGSRVMVLETADVSELVQSGWQPPEEFVVKAADGKTDLRGLIRKPWNFDAGRKYPVVEYIYGGPHVTNAPNTFMLDRLDGGNQLFCDALAQLGFITLVVDARGTPERSKAFQDFVYGNLGRAQIEDHVTAVRSAARTRPYMDLDRVGIFGSSYGGFFATRALLEAPDLYKVGVASAPVVRLDSLLAAPTESYLGGRPQDVPEAYDRANNSLLAGRLRSKLLILQPTSDVTVPFSQSMQMIEALIRAGKQYDFNVLPESNHWFYYEDMPLEHGYWRSTVRDYLVDHLQP